MTTALETLMSRIEKMGPSEKANLQRQLDEVGVLDQFEVWKPQAGPQCEAYFSKADLTLYGGAAGGGKSDLIAGLSLFAHHKIAIFRDTLGSLKGLVERMNAIMRQAGMGRIAGTPPKWVGPDERIIEFGQLGKPGSEQDWQGRDHDLKAFDEGAQLDPRKIIFVLGWLRSTRQGQHCRGLIATNPPLGGQGDFLVEWFGPWLDPMHPRYPARAGELLYAVFLDDGDEIRTHWVDGPEPVEIEGEIRTPKSRTFIPALRKDNKYLGADYDAQLDAMPEPMRTALKTGDFMAARKDHEWQVIPSEWIELAFQRWETNKDQRLRMDVIGVDVAQGGADKTVLAPLRGVRFDPPIIRRGVDTKDGSDVGSLVIKERRDNAYIVVDATGGWGGDTIGFLTRENKIDVGSAVFSEGSGSSAKDSKMPFLNKRAEWYWRFRESLHPTSGDDIALPRDGKIKAELTAARWELRGRSIKIESKDEIRERTGSSPDIADALVIAWGFRDRAAIKRTMESQELCQSVPIRSRLDDF